MLNRSLEYLTTFVFGDPGLGSLHGGFGLVFWGLGLPSVAYLIFRGFQSISRSGNPSAPSWWPEPAGKKRRDWFFLFFWGQLAVGILALFLYAGTVDLLSRSGRLVLYVTGIGLVGLGVVWNRITREIPAADLLLKGICIGGGLLTLVLLGDYRLPMYNLEKPLGDRIQRVPFTPFKYLFLGSVLDPLDEMTRHSQGISVYLAAPHSLFFTTHFYGTRIQNRIYNFEENPDGDPDALVYYHNPIDRSLFYLNRRITPEEVFLDPRYILVSHSENSLFFLKRSVLENPRARRALEDFYFWSAPHLVPVAKQVSSQLEPDGVILTSNVFGYSFRSLEMAGEITQRVILVPAGSEEVFARKLDERMIYTLGRPLTGYRSEKVAAVPLGEGEFPIFKNQKEK